MKGSPPAPEAVPPSGPALDTATLVHAARAGDRAAFGMLYERYVRTVHGVLLANAQRDDVRDLVQDVFLTALEQLHRLRDPEAFGAWLVVIARNRAKMHYRAFRPTVPIPEELPGPGDTSRGLGATDVLRALRELPDRYREPLVLRLVEELSGEEIARQTGLSHGTVRVYLHHGMKLLRDRLGGSHA
ncbi:MAG: sigma-70 family RNA polymerase sigma factor [Gemmatimonadaceae bacterium]